MTTVLTLFRRTLLYLKSRWTTWVFFALACFFGITAAPTAQYLPDILSSLAGPDLPIDTAQLPDPTIRDAWAQWSSQLQQLFPLFIAIMAGGLISTDVAGRTIIPLLSRGVSRRRYWWVSFASLLLVICASVLCGLILVLVISPLFFEMDAGDLRAPLLFTLRWVLFILPLVGIAMLASACGASSLGAAALGLVYFAVCTVLVMSPHIASYTPAGLLLDWEAGGEALEDRSVWVSVLESAALSVLVLEVGSQRFRRLSL